MKTTRLIAVAITVSSAFAQQPGVKRTELQRHDVSVPGREVIQMRVDIDPGVALPMHSHLQWTDNDVEGRTGLVRDAKHPTAKEGSD